MVGPALQEEWESRNSIYGQGFEPLGGEGRVVWASLNAGQFAAEICYRPLLPAMSGCVSNSDKQYGQELI